ncbi:MAG: DegQ family serine endoprotease [Alphaproteobacteria bacterium]
MPMPDHGSRSRLSSLAAIMIAVAIPFLAGSAVPAAIASRDAPESFADLATTLSPTVVNISTSQKLRRPRADAPAPRMPANPELDEFFKEFTDQGKKPPKRVTSLGSGFVVDPSGIIVTNNHVIEDADQITVTFNDGSTLPAKVVGRDGKTDIALLKVAPKKPLPAVRLGDSDRARVGEWVMAIGNPFGLGGSVTVGIISARNRDINSGPYDDFIQTDAPINRGNSGGPLFNMRGEVIGVNSAIFSPTGGSVGIAFAIPSSMARGVIAQLRQYGQMRRGWLGVRIQEVTSDIAQSLGMKSARGALIAGVTPKGPAAKGGIMTGDLVIGFDNRPVADSRVLPRMVADAPAGKTVSVEIWRKGARKSVQVTIGKLQDVADKARPSEEDEPVMRASPSSAIAPAPRMTSPLGVDVEVLSAKLRARFHIGNNVRGVVVTEVDEDGPAAEKHIAVGDVILEVAQEAVKTPDEFRSRVSTALKAARGMVLLLVSRDGELSFVAVPVGKS